MLKRLFRKRPRPFGVGDKLPIDAIPPGPIGAFVEVCPYCRRIEAIYVP